jgi:hypothetical protein
MLNKALRYAHKNEHVDRLVLVHVCDSQTNVPPLLSEAHFILDHIYPKIKLDLVSG